MAAGSQRGPEEIAAATDGVDLDPSTRFGKLPAQPGNVRVERVRLHLVIEAVHALLKRLPKNGSAPALHQHRENAHLAAGKIETNSVDERLIVRQIEGECP